MALVAFGLLFALFLFLDRLGLDWLILKLAEIDKWWSPYRMQPEGGVIQMYSKGLGTKKGNFALLLHGDIPEWHYHLEDRRFYHEDDPVFKEKFPDGIPVPGGRLNRLGVGKVRLFRHLYKRERSWTTWGQVKDQASQQKTSEYGIRIKEMKGDEASLFYFSTKMAVRVESIRTKDLVLVDVNVPFNVLLIDPEKAEFVAGKWEDQAISAVRSRAAEFIRSHTYTELQGESDSHGTDDFVDVILRANTKQAVESGSVGIIEAYGIQVIEPRFEDLELIKEEGDQDVEDALRRKQIAIHDLETADILLQKAEKEGQAKAKVLTEEAVGIRDMVKVWASVPEGAQLRAAQAIEKTRLTAIGANTLIDIGAQPKERLVQEA